MPEPIFGLEIECGHGVEDIAVGEYHKGIPCGEYWNAQSDSSIHVGGLKATEFVLNKPLTAAEIPEALKELRRIVKNGNTDTFRNFAINKSCGAHIHFSKEGRKLFRNIPFRCLGALRKSIFSKVRKELPDVFPDFRKQYFREYSKKMTIERVLGDRGVEFWYTQKTGVEWRAFNLVGVKTWKELYKMYDIAIGGLSDMLAGLDKSAFSYEGSIAVSDQLVDKLVIKNEKSSDFNGLVQISRNPLVVDGVPDMRPSFMPPQMMVCDPSEEPVAPSGHGSGDHSIELTIGGVRTIIRY